MAKRTRSVEHEETARECPICYTGISARTEARPFQCDHGLCQTCSTRMREESDHRCPECRAPRRGMSPAEAEPDPNRNHTEQNILDIFSGFLPAVESYLGNLENLEIPGELAAFAAAQGLALPGGTGAAGGYGQPPGRRPFRRPNTGHLMFFPHETPTDHDPSPPPHGFGSVAVPLSGGSSREREREQAHTLVAVGAVPAEIVNALFNVPEVSITEWHQTLRRLAGASSSTRRPTRRPSGRSR